MILDYLEPLEMEALQPQEGWAENQLGTLIQFFTEDYEVDIDELELAIISVSESRGSRHNPSCGDHSQSVRKELYSLYHHFPAMPRMADLGKLRIGHSLRDTQSALSYVLQELIGRGVVCVVLGAGHDLTYGQYGAYELANPRVNMVVVDETIDVEQRNEVDSTSHLFHIMMREPNYLFGLTHLGHQAFYTDPKWIDTVEVLGFRAIRLGEMTGAFPSIEPYIRDADMMSIDTSALRGAIAPAHARTSPNGLGGEDICRICRYAGYSNSLSSIGFYETNAHFEQNGQTARLLSQMMWYFIEGYANRVEDYPSDESKEHIRYNVHNEEVGYDLIFIRSKRTDRWWMEIPEEDEVVYISCSKQDYDLAMKGELPDRWMEAYKKLG